MIELISARHIYPEKAGVVIDRKNGLKEYTFLHFYNSVKIVLNGNEFFTQPHSVLIYNKDTPQFFKSEQPLLHDWFHFSGDCDKILSENGLEFDKIYYPHNYDFITKIVAEFEKEIFNREFRSKEFVNIKFNELILKIKRALQTENVVTDRDIRERLRFLRGEIFVSLDKNWNISEMARIVNLSESHFFKVYKSIFGISPISDIINARINVAKNLLCSTDFKIEDIAGKLGYDNTTHFIRQFKKTVGLTPTDYRKNSTYM